MILDIVYYLGGTGKGMADRIQVVNPTARSEDLVVVDDKPMPTMNGMPAVQRIFDRNSAQKSGDSAASQSSDAPVANVCFDTALADDNPWTHLKS